MTTDLEEGALGITEHFPVVEGDKSLDCVIWMHNELGVGRRRRGCRSGNEVDLHEPVSTPHTLSDCREVDAVSRKSSAA
jgi:hypothetical protein